MAELCSQGGGGPCVLRFKNERETSILIFWLDYEGKAVSYGVIPAGLGVDQSTYTCHAWRLCDEGSGLCLAEYAGASAIVTLRADGSTRVVSTAASTLDGFSEPVVAAGGAAGDSNDEGEDEAAA